MLSNILESLFAFLLDLPYCTPEQHLFFIHIDIILYKNTVVNKKIRFFESPSIWLGNAKMAQRLDALAVNEPGLSNNRCTAERFIKQACLTTWRRAPVPAGARNNQCGRPETAGLPNSY
ncbi:MAG: hypothetical protein N3A66_04310 [Planctomycetota bacterium]|nr:hypothetical protein [Planctomycetota bacterium]